MSTSPDSFENPKGKIKPKASSTKRVALVLFVGVAILMVFVTYAILNSGMNVRSSEPVKLYQPAEGNADTLENLSKLAPEPPKEEEPEEFEEELAMPDTLPVNVYTPAAAPQVSERAREEHSQRLLAANAKTMIDGFADGQSAKSGRQSSNAVADAETAYAAAIGTDAQAAANTAAMHQGIVAQGQGGNQVADPNGWNAKERFISQGGKLPEGYSAHFRTPQVSEMEIKAGTIIPCVLVSGLNSDLPGNSIGQVSENVYDSATGKHLLIPRGAKVVGTYDNRVSYGQSRMLVVWSKLVYPDGSTLMLENYSATDQSGYTGVKGQINRHWNSIITSALIVSLLGAGVELASPTDNNDDRDEDDPRTIVAENAARAVAEAMSKIIQREADRAPTIKIKPGYRFLLFVRQDMIFQQAWQQ